MLYGELLPGDVLFYDGLKEKCGPVLILSTRTVPAYGTAHGFEMTIFEKQEVYVRRSFKNSMLSTVIKVFRSGQRLS